MHFLQVSGDTKKLVEMGVTDESIGPLSRIGNLHAALCRTVRLLNSSLVSYRRRKFQRNESVGLFRLHISFSVCRQFGHQPRVLYA